ncbi:MAG: putative porin [bacterium]|nr:putative porin [bacterium]
MRWITMLTLAAMLSITAAWAEVSTYEDVQPDHWAYTALDYLTEEGVLEGYPDGYFKGDRTLTRYEFAQAIARLLDTIESEGADEQVNIMAETLRAEFSDQLEQMNAKLGEINAAMGDLDGRVAELEGNVADHGTRVASLEEQIACMTPGPDWKGEFRYRWQYESRDTPPLGVAADDTTDRFRQRIQFMLGYNKQINERTEVGFRFKTNTGDSLTSGNFTLGQNAGDTADIFLDRAYVKYSPGWFGYYLDEDSACQEKLDLYAGIFPQINYDPHEAILDADVNLQGLGAVYHFNRDFQILTAISVASEQDTGDLDDDAILSITELRYNNLFTCGFDVWAGCYCWLNESALPSSYFTDNRLQGFDFNNNGIADEGGDRFSSQFKTAKVGAQYTFDCVWNKPLAIYGEYLVNTDSDAENRINAVNPFITPDIIYESTDDTGFVVGAQWGEKPTCVGDWYWFARYKEIGANAIVDGFGDADAGGANTNSFEANATWMWADNALFGITYFLNRMNNAFGFLIPANKADQQIIQIDWTFKF